MTLKVGDLVTPIGFLYSGSTTGYSKNAIIGVVIGEIDWHLDDDHRGHKQKRYEVKFPNESECTFWNEEELIIVLKNEAQ